MTCHKYEDVLWLFNNSLLPTKNKQVNKERKVNIKKYLRETNIWPLSSTLDLWLAQYCNPAHTTIPRLYYCGTPQDRTRGDGWGGGRGRREGCQGAEGSVKNYSEQHRSRQQHKQRRDKQGGQQTPETKTEEAKGGGHCHHKSTQYTLPFMPLK